MSAGIGSAPPVLLLKHQVVKVYEGSAFDKVVLDKAHMTFYLSFRSRTVGPMRLDGKPIVRRKVSHKWVKLLIIGLSHLGHIVIEDLAWHTSKELEGFLMAGN